MTSATLASRSVLRGIALAFSAGISATVLLAAPPLSIVKPESAGLSSVRLQRVGTWVDRLQADGKISGAVTVVFRRGQLVRFEAQGYGDLESRRALRPDDIFAIASMTKPVTTAGVLMLLEEQRLLLSDPVEKFCPNSPTPRSPCPRRMLRAATSSCPPPAASRFTTC